MSKRGSRGQYVPLDDVKEQLLQAAAELFEQAPMAPPHPVSFGEALKAAGVPRTSAYRAFGDADVEPQEALTHELIRRVSGPALAGYDQRGDRGLDLLKSVESDEDVDPARLAWVCQEFIRLAAADFGAAMVRSGGARLYTMSLFSEQNDALRTTIDEVERDALGDEPMAALNVQPMLDACGLRLIPSVDSSTAARSILSVGLGSFMYPSMASEGHYLDLPTGRDGEVQPWTLAGILLMGFARMVLEPDPDAAASADLSTLVAVRPT
ncbi:MAG: hypothetical protein AAF567_06340 [Actinomycetota bacterium]